MKKIFMSLGLIVVVAVVGLMVGRNSIVRAVVVSGIKAITGVTVDISKLDIGFPATYVSVAGITVHNPAGFTDPVMADVPEIYISYDLPAFMRNNVHVLQMRFDLKELVVVRDQTGKVNLNSLAVLIPKDNGKPASSIKIDLMTLAVGKVVYKDYFSGRLMTSEINLNMRERFTNITDIKALVGVILSKALKNANLADVLGIDLDSLNKGASDASKNVLPF